MALLTRIVEDALDAGYAEAAARRADPVSRWRPGWVLTIGLVAVGLLLATAAAQTRNRAPAAAQARAALAAEVERRDAANDQLAADLDRLRSQVADERRRALVVTGEGVDVGRRLTRLEAATGLGDVHGPGFVLRLSDAPSGVGPDGLDPRDSTGGSQGRVTDRDLQTLVNQVWAAGAEAVSINGQRLTGLSAIRSAGDAVLVDFRPLSPPYSIDVIGAPDIVRTKFAEGFGGSYLQVLHDYGITYSIRAENDLTLPASAGVTIRYAAARGERSQ
jgi:uncharacterized protein YlxW (UPF0749 family)